MFLDRILVGRKAQISMTTEETLDPVALRDEAHLDGVIDCKFVLTFTLHSLREFFFIAKQ